MENLCILCIDVKVAYLQIPENIISLKHPETNSSSLKMDGWHTISFPLGPAILFRGFGCLSFREGNLYHLLEFPRLRNVLEHLGCGHPG